ncbi:MAG: hypothetical protein AAFQ13_09500, partial [Pseudomonadota bacterium]
ETPVTASSGAIVIPRATSARMTFGELYARADALMYDAKASGRNRMVSEKLTIFPTSKTPDIPRPKPVSRRERRGRAARDKSKGRVA